MGNYLVELVDGSYSSRKDCGPVVDTREYSGVVQTEDLLPTGIGTREKGPSVERQ